MALILERRVERARKWMWLSPLLALALTVVAGAIIFALAGVNPLHGLYTYFISPLMDGWDREKLIAKAAPLVLIGVGLAVAYTANVWNIGAEGQFVAGALLAGLVPVFLPAWQGPSVMAAMLLLGVIGGLAWAMVPALLRARFHANEILTSLMLVYVMRLAYDWAVRGPLRDPQAMNFPKTVRFEGWQVLPAWGEIHLGAAFALVAALVLYVVMVKMLKGFELRALGSSPRAARFAGFSEHRAIYFVFAVSGALAGLAGACDVMGVSRQLQAPYEPNYGFVAIIVAFLGRLNPVGVIFAGLLLALSYMGGETAKVTLGISDNIAKVFQGMLLIFILACDTLILYRIRWQGRA